MADAGEVAGAGLRAGGTRGVAAAAGTAAHEEEADRATVSIFGSTLPGEIVAARRQTRPAAAGEAVVIGFTEEEVSKHDQELMEDPMSWAWRVRDLELARVRAAQREAEELYYYDDEVDEELEELKRSLYALIPQMARFAGSMLAPRALYLICCVFGLPVPADLAMAYSSPAAAR